MGFLSKLGRRYKLNRSAGPFPGADHQADSFTYTRRSTYTRLKISISKKSTITEPLLPDMADNGGSVAISSPQVKISDVFSSETLEFLC